MKVKNASELEKKLDFKFWKTENKVYFWNTYCCLVDEGLDDEKVVDTLRGLLSAVEEEYGD